MLRELQVLHRREAVAELPPAIATAGAEGRAFVVHTCQRTGGGLHRPLASRWPGAAARRWHAEYYEGPHAYAFLLRLACGLESKLTGETEVFGQLKQAWAQFSERGSDQAQQLAGYMQSLFRDVKDVRSRFLSSIGSASYGSLVRRLLDTPRRAWSGAADWRRPTGRGRGAMAAWHRTVDLEPQSRARRSTGGGAARRATRSAPMRVLDPRVEAELAAWRTARDVVVCVPADTHRDARARRGLGDTARRSRPAGASGRRWHGRPERAGERRRALLHLAAVYELLRAQQRTAPGAGAPRRAAPAASARCCAALGRSDSEPHGWEDLVAIDSLCS